MTVKRVDLIQKPYTPAQRKSQDAYKKEYCELIVDMFSKGASMANFCIAVGHPRKTVYVWIDKHPEFEHAYHMARECGKAYRDETIIQNAWKSNAEDASNFDGNLYHKLTTPRFKDMEMEAVGFKELRNTDNLTELLSKVSEWAALGQLDTQQARVIGDLISTSLKAKEQDVILKKLEELEKIANNTAKGAVFEAVAESDETLEITDKSSKDADL